MESYILPIKIKRHIKYGWNKKLKSTTKKYYAIMHHKDRWPKLIEARWSRRLIINEKKIKIITPIQVQF